MPAWGCSSITWGKVSFWYTPSPPSLIAWLLNSIVPNVLNTQNTKFNSSQPIFTRFCLLIVVWNFWYHEGEGTYWCLNYVTRFTNWHFLSSRPKFRRMIKWSWWSSPWFYNLCNVTGGERVLPLQVLSQYICLNKYGRCFRYCCLYDTHRGQISRGLFD